METYEVSAEWDGRWWVLTVAGLDGGFTQARTLSKAEAMARDLIATLLDVRLDEVAVEIRALAPPDTRIGVERLLELRGIVQRAGEEASELARHLVKELDRQHLSIRDSAQVLGVSPARVHQLLRGD